MTLADACGLQRQVCNPSRSTDGHCAINVRKHLCRKVHSHRMRCHAATHDMQGVNEPLTFVNSSQIRNMSQECRLAEVRWDKSGANMATHIVHPLNKHSLFLNLGLGAKPGFNSGDYKSRAWGL